MQPSIYLFFDGDCLEAMTHYAEVLGGQTMAIIRNSDAPDPAVRMHGGDDLVMHMNVLIDGTLVMASDAPGDMYDRPRGFRVAIAPSSVAEFDRIHSALTLGARSVEMPPGETFFAERFAMFTDRFGTPWMLNYAGAKAPA